MKNGSYIFSFKYRSEDSVNDVHYVFDEPDYFASYNLANQMPLWMSQFNKKSQIISSNALFANKTSSDEATSPDIPGFLWLQARSSILPLSPESWYLALDYPD